MLKIIHFKCDEDTCMSVTIDKLVGFSIQENDAEQEDLMMHDSVLYIHLIDGGQGVLAAGTKEQCALTLSRIYKKLEFDIIYVD